jgi:addiction module RelE/StbE family toxin
MRVEIYLTKNFEDEFRKLPTNIKKSARRKIDLFRNDCFTSTLKTHKLKGKLKDLWSFSIKYDYRIMFEFVGKGKVLFYRIVTHSIYK